MKKLTFCLLLTLMSGSQSIQAAEPFTGFLPALVQDKTGKPFWCNAHLNLNKKCIATEISNLSMVIVRSQPFGDCEAGMWGWIATAGSPQKIAIGYTITPDEKFNLSLKDMCRPGTVVKFQSNKKYKNEEDLVGFYNGKEIFRYLGRK
ncbi:hypothetical protein [Aeromonas veronii]|uniref:hypothetical protein n=1 Tax=Aeromonas veronii TaxID=654 RepID=UPI001E4EDF30|nr:hypothetical protein [Aeromonas veronii]MCD6619986.1 hypothetical protein [Aeromonas veronii]